MFTQVPAPYLLAGLCCEVNTTLKDVLFWGGDGIELSAPFIVAFAKTHPTVTSIHFDDLALNDWSVQAIFKYQVIKVQKLFFALNWLWVKLGAVIYLIPKRVISRFRFLFFFCSCILPVLSVQKVLSSSGRATRYVFAHKAEPSSATRAGQYLLDW